VTAPTVSVIMAAYNGAAMIGETLDSLWAQTFGDFELVVVDDGSTDDTRAILRAQTDPRVRLIEAGRNGGPVRARNRAVTEARGRYLAGLDQDDLCLPDRFARQVAYLDAHPDVTLVAGDARIFNARRTWSGSRVPVTTPALLEWLLLIENPLVWSTVMARREGLPPGEFTRPDMLYAEDFDLYHRVVRHGGRIGRLDQPVLLYREHVANISRRFTDHMQDSAGQVLAETYAEAGREDPAGDAALVVRHLMQRAPVPDRATLERLGATISGLQAHYLATHDVGASDRRAIRWETAIRWGRVLRASLRDGGISLIDAMRVRPDHLGMGYLGANVLLSSGLIGAARSARRRAA